MAQSDSALRPASPYKNEYNPWFKLSTFQRGFDNDSLKIVLDQLEAKSRETWTRNDSLVFAETCLNTGNLELSEYYFNALKVDYSTEKEFWWDHVILCFLNDKTKDGLAIIRHDHPGILQLSELYFLEKIFEAKIEQQRDPKWYKTNSITQWFVDSTNFNLDRWSPEYKTKIIEPLSHLNSVLRRLIHHVYDSDPIIACACSEMGMILENYVSWTQAYIAYSLGRNYNKRDKEILTNIRRVKTKLSKKKYKIPIFRRYFPRIEEWRFEYKVLKEKILKERADTLLLQKPQLMIPKKDVDLIIPPPLIIISGVSLIFLLVLIFLRTKQK